MEFVAVISGQAMACWWDFGDGTVLSNRTAVRHTWSACGDYTVAFRAYNQTYPEGVSVAVTIRVVIHYVSAASLSPLPPYGSWDTAARTIQEAVDATTGPGALVVVSNGLYATGGRAVYGTMTNRVAVGKAIRVQSVNGPEVTVIQGYQVPDVTNGDGAIRCVYLAAGAVLSGFTLTNGATRTTGDLWQEQSGGGVWCESASALVTNCMLTRNVAFQDGGGACAGTLGNCIVTANAANRGGGADAATLHNCLLTANSATFAGGGTEHATLINCTVTGNSAYYGAGVSFSTLNNCIVYYNTAITTTPQMTGQWCSTLDYCCVPPGLDAGVGCITNEPQLAGSSHLSPGSPCRGAGSAACVTGVDLGGEPWLDPPSIGCAEYRAGAVTGAISVLLAASFTNVSIGATTDLTAWIGGRVARSIWDLADGTTVTNQPYVSHAWNTVGNHTVTLRAYNESFPEGVSGVLTIQVVPPVRYVSAASRSPVPPFQSWTTAARTIQEAVDAAQDGDEIVVSNGVYAAGGRAVVGAQTSNRVVVARPLVVRSLNGPRVTVILGHQQTGTGYNLGKDAIRCAYLADGAVLSGFTLTNGATSASDGNGGGVYCASVGVVVTNCILASNAAVAGGGAYAGTLRNCVLTGNTANDGGGACGATLHNCLLTANQASGSGGGLLAPYDNGVFQGMMYHCTLTGNAARFGGGAWHGTLINCILYANTASFWGADHESAVLTACWLEDPLFQDPLRGNYRLRPGSPCINQGAYTYAYVSGPSDLDGRPRLVGGNVDLGAYEFQDPVTDSFLVWLAQHDLPMDASAESADPDGDGLDNWREWLGGTSPTDASSTLRLLPPTNSRAGVLVTWQSVTNRSYCLERSTNLAARPAFLPLARDIPGEPGTTTSTDTNVLSAGPVFYRVGTQP